MCRELAKNYRLMEDICEGGGGAGDAARTTRIKRRRQRLLCYWIHIFLLPLLCYSFNVSRTQSRRAVQERKSKRMRYDHHDTVRGSITTPENKQGLAASGGDDYVVSIDFERNGHSKTKMLFAELFGLVRIPLLRRRAATGNCGGDNNNEEAISLDSPISGITTMETELQENSQREEEKTILENTGHVETVAGGGTGYQDGNARTSLFNCPQALQAGYVTGAMRGGREEDVIYVADCGNACIRAIFPDRGEVVTAAGEAVGTGEKEASPRYFRIKTKATTEQLKMQRIAETAEDRERDELMENAGLSVRKIPLAPKSGVEFLVKEDVLDLNGLRRGEDDYLRRSATGKEGGDNRAGYLSAKMEQILDGDPQQQSPVHRKWQYVFLAGSTSRDRGYADGMGTNALFSHPSSLITVHEEKDERAGGGVECPRCRYLQSCYTASKAEWREAVVDGPSATATLRFPLHLALSHDGSLLVTEADAESSPENISRKRLRRISKQGQVTSLWLSAAEPPSLSSSSAAHDENREAMIQQQQQQQQQQHPATATTAAKPVHSTYGPSAPCMAFFSSRILSEKRGECMLIMGPKSSPRGGGSLVELLCPAPMWKERYEEIARATTATVQARVMRGSMNQRITNHTAGFTAALATERGGGQEKPQFSQQQQHPQLAKQRRMERCAQEIAEKLENKTLSHTELMK
eukprot:jgi/Bigna1/83433/fgenesh1_pg.108_\